MSKMSNLDAELRAAGIDPEGVDWERVLAYQRMQGVITGRATTIMEAVEFIYNKWLIPQG